ncbi:TonB-dependent receptor [Puia dinghuensis]|uniref:Collagen-binding protein n=1 Tax=Puia dinghuensis TaxID=1792502 RepID=A0A8J2UHE3_9BACT|nr:TonB-dependent receptor [Puia dinghuensis]GGB18144.1 collagen-binding protein [Puia dinghuensis]
MKKNILTFFFSCLSLLMQGLPLPAVAQARYTVSGTVRAKRSGENVIRATVAVSGQTVGVTTNEYGFFSLTLPEGEYSLVVSAVGLQSQMVAVELRKNLSLAVSLEEGATELKEVVVSAADRDRKLSGVQIGTERLTISTMRSLPVLLGERDVLKSVQLLPGVASAGDGNTGFYVRGGAADQNLILLDGTTVYNPSHLLGFFSTFNPDAVRDLTLYKGAMPPQYGGRLSSVADIRMNEGNNQGYHATATAGLLTVSGEVEGPIEKDRSSFLVAGRTTRINAALHASGDTTINRNDIGFYDLNAKLNFALGRRDHLYVSGYYGRDDLSVYNQFGLKWGNGIANLRWNHVVGARLFSNTTLAISNYSNQITGYVNSSKSPYTVDASLNDYSVKQEWEWYAGVGHTMRFGLGSIYHTIQPARLNAPPGTGLNDTTYQSRYGWENVLYAGDEWKATDRLTLSYGLRLTDFRVYGGGNFYHFDAAGNAKDTLHYRSGQPVVNYFNPEPRLAIGYELDDQSTLKASYNRNVQNVHLLTNSAASFPTDRWTLTTNNILPEIADQVSLGYYRETADRGYTWSLETYYKLMQHQIDFRTGANPELTDMVESELLYGKGRAYGVELELRKNKGKLTGWLSYTLSRSQLQIGGINDGRWYDATQDHTHNISVVGIYKPNPKWTFSADWVYYTGAAISYPSGKYEAGGRIVYYYAERNGYRMPAYHRLDLSATDELKKKKHFSEELVFSIYNAYDRLNAYFINFRQDPNDATQTQAVKTVLFGIVPSVAFTIKF